MEVQSRKSTYVTFPPDDDDCSGSSGSTSGINNGRRGSGTSGGGAGRDESPSKSAKRNSAYIRNWRYRCFEKFKGAGLAIFILANVGLSIWIVVFHGNLPEIFPMNHFFSLMRSPQEKRCHFPELNPHSQEVKMLLVEPERISCYYAANTDFRGEVFFKTDKENNLIRISDPRIPCCYRPIYRINDNEAWIEPTKDRRYVCHNITEKVTKIPTNHEFIEVICDNLRKSFRDAFAFVPRKPKVDERVKETIKKIKEEEGEIPERLSVILLGFDSTSQLNFIRRMPKSTNYLLKSMGAIRLEGYNKVGENTLPNVTPLLTGLELSEFKQACIDKFPSSEISVHIDGCPFIWKNFSSKGYYTSFSEDEVATGIFNLYWPFAFQEQPTDYYLRTFSHRMFQTQNTYDGMCQGSRMSFEVLLDNIEKTAKTFENKNDSYFQFTWSSKLTHDNFNRLGWADLPLYRTLKFLNHNGLLNNTVLILVGDHGSRAQAMRKTRQGQFEDRMPLGYIVMPRGFQEKYPMAMGNLKKNAEALTTPFDIYETLKDLMDLRVLNDMWIQYRRQSEIRVAEKKGLRKGTSLFTALPEYRGCTSAGIPPHWCICYKKFPVPVKSKDVQEATSFIVTSLNNLIRPYAKNCAKLNLYKVKSALKWHPEEAIQDTYSGNTDENFKRSSLLQIEFVTYPGKMEFEVTVIYEPDNGWKFTEQVVRIDPYEAHSKCMQKQELKKLCFCTEPKKKLLGFDALDTGHNFPFF